MLAGGIVCSRTMFSYLATKANAAFAGSKVSVTVKDKPGNVTVVEKIV
jgi:hypothetical protein